MSRRKQSNPKPLKREDEEWGNESEAMPGEPRTPSSAGSRGASSGGGSPASGGPSPAPAPSPPRLRLNTALATDPALAPQAVRLKREPPSPSPPTAAPPAHAPAPAPTSRDFLAAAAAAFPGLFPAAAPGYMCTPCNIRYSSLSTLQAHQEHYCSNRLPKPPATDSPSDTLADESSGDSKTPRPHSKQYACTQCSYSADKKVSLNRHMRMHSASPVSAGAPPAPTPAPPANGDAADGPPAQDRYCTDCDIRFSSIKTFRAHKSHYCSTRQVVKGAGSGTARSGGSVTSGSAPPSPGPTPPAGARSEYALALPTNPILILPMGLLRNASTLPGATLPDPDAPCFLLPNGTFQPLSQALSSVESGERGAGGVVLRSANRSRSAARDGTVPLDLSLRRSPEAHAADDPEKENRLRSATPEQIVCAPSLPPSPGTLSPSPRRSASPASGERSPKRRRRSHATTPKPPSTPEDKFRPEEKFRPDEKFRHEDKLRPEEKFGPAGVMPHALALRLAGELAPAAPPSMVVKQGVAKCNECNIVFCLYESYRVHKRLYCASGGGEERASPAPEPGPPPQYRQLICLPCGIHFSSLDNLQTHQSFYCPKRETRSPRGVAEARSGVGGAGAGEGGWKCPCCEMVSPTAAAAQRHMEAHKGVKAFRCTICRYRGNTLRGMRTHIRMHFNNKKPADLQEETYIECVLENENRETTSPNPAPTSDRVHRCSSCAYTSTYRGNVIRHARLVHATDEPEEDHSPTLPTVPITVSPTIDIKKEPEPEVEEAVNYCKSCDISFKYVKTFKAHKQFYCTANNQESVGNNNVPAPARVSDTPVL